MAVIQIPGGSATLRDKLVSERHFRILEAAYMAAGGAMQKVQQASVTESGETATEEEMAAAMAGVTLSTGEAMSLLDLQNAAIVAFLERWSLGIPLPTLDTVADLDRATYKALSEATRVLATAALGAQPKFDPAKEKKDPESGLDFPTGDSRPSDLPWRAEVESFLTETPPTSGENTATDSYIQG